MNPESNSFVVADVAATAGVRDGDIKLRIDPAPLPISATNAFAESALTDSDTVTALDPGQFPLHALNRTMRRIVEEIVEVHQVAPELPGMTATATLAGALGKGWACVEAVNQRNTYGNLFVIAAAPKSYGKGACAEIARPIIEASKEIAEEFRRSERPQLRAEMKVLERRHKVIVEALTNSKTAKSLSDVERQALHQELVDAEARMSDIEGLVRLLPSYWIGNATTAALTDHLVRNKEVLFSFSPEAGDLVRILLGKFNKNSAADCDLYLSGYTVEPYRETRVGRGDNPLTPCLSVLWFCQPFLVKELLRSEEALERGMTARTLTFVITPDSVPEDTGDVRSVSERAWLDWSNLIDDLLKERTSVPEPIQCSPDAREVFRQFHNESVRLRNGPFQDIEGELGRWRENAIRIAIGQCVADAFTHPGGRPESMVMSGEQAAQSVEIARWCCRSSLKVQDWSRCPRLHETLERILQILKACGGKITVRSLRDRHGIETGETRVIAQRYPKLICLTVEKPRTGRPSEVVSLAPAGQTAPQS
jgi:hypothetical protein